MRLETIENMYKLLGANICELYLSENMNAENMRNTDTDGAMQIIRGKAT